MIHHKINYFKLLFQFQLPQNIEYLQSNLIEQTDCRKNQRNTDV